jgi:hypothetical protein
MIGSMNVATGFFSDPSMSPAIPASAKGRGSDIPQPNTNDNASHNPACDIPLGVARNAEPISKHPIFPFDKNLPKGFRLQKLPSQKFEA